jgi:Cu/Ag efflux protein CusF
MTRFPRLAILSFTLAAALLLASYATAEHHEGEPAEGAVIVGEKITRHGKVISIDAETRTVVVEGEQGRQIAIVAPEESPNFDEIKVGDPVVATYVEAIALAIAPVANAEPGASAAAVVATAPEGEAPGAAMAEQIQLRAVVKAVDPATRAVTLDVSEGGERTLKASDAVDIENVKVGEQVSVTLTRALAISIDKK